MRASLRELLASLAFLSCSVRAYEMTSGIGDVQYHPGHPVSNNPNPAASPSLAPCAMYTETHSPNTRYVQPRGLNGDLRT